MGCGCLLGRQAGVGKECSGIVAISGTTETIQVWGQGDGIQGHRQRKEEMSVTPEGRGGCRYTETPGNEGKWRWDSHKGPLNQHQECELG